MITNHYFIQDIINLIPFTNKYDYLNLISTCKECRISEQLFFKKYFINLKSINISVYYALLSNLNFIMIRNFYNKIVNLRIDTTILPKKINKCSLPKNLKKIIFSKKCYIEQFIDNLPQQLIELNFYDKIIGVGLLKTLPPNLKKLHLPVNFNELIPSGSFPKTLVQLALPRDYNNNFKVRSFPNSLRKLYFYNIINYDKIPPNVFPDGLNIVSLINMKSKYKIKIQNILENYKYKDKSNRYINIIILKSKNLNI